MNCICLLNQLKMRYPTIVEIFGLDQIRKLCEAPSYWPEHPLKWLLKGALAKDGDAANALGNTENALRAITGDKSMNTWVRKNARKATNSPTENEPSKVYDALADAYKALAELRAAGYLCRCGFKVQPSSESKKGFDLLAKHESTEICVEVSALRITKKEAEKWWTKCEEKSISWAGTEKEGEFSVDNIVHKIVQNASEENKQLPSDRPSILWFDLQFEDSWALSVEEAWPLYTLRRGYFRTGGIWLAFYGRKQTPLLDHESLQEGLPPKARGIRFTSLRYPGYFATKNSMASAVVLTWPHYTLIFENPWSINALSTPTLTYLLRLDHFDWPRSVVRPFWEEDAIHKLQKRVEETLRMISSLAKIACLDW